VGPEKEAYLKGEFLPQLRITLEDKYGNLSRQPQRVQLINCVGCTPEKKVFKCVHHINDDETCMSRPHTTVLLFVL